MKMTANNTKFNWVDTVEEFDLNPSMLSKTGRVIKMVPRQYIITWTRSTHITQIEPFLQEEITMIENIFYEMTNRTKFLEGFHTLTTTVTLYTTQTMSHIFLQITNMSSQIRRRLVGEIHMRVMQTHNIQTVHIQFQNESYPIHQYPVFAVAQAIHLIADPPSKHEIQPTVVSSLPQYELVVIAQVIVPPMEENPANM